MGTIQRASEWTVSKPEIRQPLGRSDHRPAGDQGDLHLAWRAGRDDARVRRRGRGLTLYGHVTYPRRACGASKKEIVRRPDPWERRPNTASLSHSLPGTCTSLASVGETPILVRKQSRGPRHWPRISSEHCHKFARHPCPIRLQIVCLCALLWAVRSHLHNLRLRSSPTISDPQSRTFPPQYHLCLSHVCPAGSSIPHPAEESTPGNG